MEKDCVAAASVESIKILFISIHHIFITASILSSTKSLQWKFTDVSSVSSSCPSSLLVLLLSIKSGQSSCLQLFVEFNRNSFGSISIWIPKLSSPKILYWNSTKIIKLKLSTFRKNRKIISNLFLSFVCLHLKFSFLFVFNALFGEVASIVNCDDKNINKQQQQKTNKSNWM